MDLSVSLSTYVMMTAFLSADVGPAVGVAGDVRGEIFGVSAELRVALPSRTYAREPIAGATSTRPADFDLTQITALLVPCARYKWFVGCGVVQFGWFIMNSVTDTEDSATFGFGPRLGFEVPFAERFAFFGFGEVLFAPQPRVYRFVLPIPDHPEVTPNNTKWTQSVASAFLGAGLSIKFR
jgi:hypothetical protein